MVNISLLIYRSRSPELAPFHVPLFPLTPVLGIVTCLGLAIYQLYNEPVAWVLAIVWILIGLMIYRLAFSRRAMIADVPRVIEEPALLNLKKTKDYKILVPLANPERVESLIEISAKVACASQGEVLALNVISLPNITAYDSSATPLLAEAQMVLNKAQAIPFSSLLKIGRSAAEEITRVARDSQRDLIPPGYKKEEDPLGNSAIHRVIDLQSCDVAILKSDTGYVGPFERVLVPVGGTDINDQLKVRLLHSIFRDTNCQVTFMTVVSPAQGNHSQAESTLQRAAKIYSIPNSKLILEENDQVAAAIINQAAGHDLLVLGMREESWLQSFFFGTVAQRVAGQVQCPTLLVKAYAAEKSRLRRLLRVESNPWYGLESAVIPGV